MDNLILKKKLSTFRTPKGSLTRVSDDVLVEVLREWEAWPGSTKDFYTSIGVSQRQMAVLVGKAKKLKREGRFPVEEFREIKLAEEPQRDLGISAVVGIELALDRNRLIRFSGVPQLIEFLVKFPLSQSEAMEIKKAG